MIPTESALYRALRGVAMAGRIAVFAGLPGIGKSLLTTQTASIARDAGRSVSIVQWDIVRRQSFEGEPYRTRHPERKGIADPVVRIAVDTWLRAAIARWQNDDPDGLLLIEAPLIGGRLISLVHTRDDAAEPLLASPNSTFLLPVPTRAVKDALRLKRHAAVSANASLPDARVDVLDALVEEINQAGIELGLVSSGVQGYDPDIYAAVFLHVMRHRHCLQLSIGQIFETGGTTGEKPYAALTASPEDVAGAYAAAEAIPAPLRERLVAGWYR